MQPVGSQVSWVPNRKEELCSGRLTQTVLICVYKLWQQLFANLHQSVRQVASHKLTCAISLCLNVVTSSLRMLHTQPLGGQLVSTPAVAEISHQTEITHCNHWAATNFLSYFYSGVTEPQGRHCLGPGDSDLPIALVSSPLALRIENLNLARTSLFGQLTKRR